jgi:hypothetical protein
LIKTSITKKFGSIVNRFFFYKIGRMAFIVL